MNNSKKTDFFSNTGYTDGGEWSRRANRALENGRRPAATIAKDLGATTLAVETVLKSSEWHHVGEKMECVYFYDAADVACEKAEFIDDATDARAFKNVVEIKTFAGRVEPRQSARTSSESRDDEYDLFRRSSSTTRAKSACADAFEAAIALLEDSVISIEDLREKAVVFEKTMIDFSKKIKKEISIFLKKHKDWKRVIVRAKKGTNGLCY